MMGSSDLPMNADDGDLPSKLLRSKPLRYSCASAGVTSSILTPLAQVTKALIRSWSWRIVLCWIPSLALVSMNLASAWLSVIPLLGQAEALTEGSRGVEGV